MRARPIASIVIAGGGIVAWSAAAALRRRFQAVSVTVVPLPSPPGALADRMTGTLPSIAEFHADIGLGEADTVVRAGSGFRLGTRFEGWAGDRAAYVHAYGEYGRPFGTASFHHHWARAAKAGTAAPFDAHSAAAAMGEAGRFVHPRGEPGTPLAGFGYGLQIDPARYPAMMRAFALHLGARERGGAIAGVRLRGTDGFIEALALDDGTALAADLFIDATGPAALLRSELNSAWDDWSGWLACDRILVAEKSPAAEIPSVDKAVALPSGWRWEAASPARVSHGLVYASAHLSDSKAERVLRNGAGVEAQEAPIALSQGRRPQPWLRNCVAIGDAALCIEPLEWTNLHLAHNAIDRLISMMPDADCSPVEIWDYNRQTAAETDRVRDFLVLHYIAADRPADPFWRDVSGRAPPPSLAHTLEQFRARGRLPFYEDETFARDSWLSVLFGQGVLPARVDPLIDVMSEADSDRTMAQIRQSIQTLVQTLPTHSDYLRTLSRQSAR